jgi:hypothetical protein
MKSLWLNGALARIRTGMTFRSTDFKSVDPDLTPKKSLLFQSLTDFARVQAVCNLQVITRFRPERVQSLHTRE